MYKFLICSMTAINIINASVYSCIFISRILSNWQIHLFVQKKKKKIRYFMHCNYDKICILNIYIMNIKIQKCKYIMAIYIIMLLPILEYFYQQNTVKFAKIQSN